MPYQNQPLASASGDVKADHYRLLNLSKKVILAEKLKSLLLNEGYLNLSNSKHF